MTCLSPISECSEDTHIYFAMVQIFLLIYYNRNRDERRTESARTYALLLPLPLALDDPSSASFRKASSCS